MYKKNMKDTRLQLVLSCGNLSKIRKKPFFDSMKQQKVNAILEMLDSYSPTCSHVRGWDVNAGSEESLLGELHGESASDALQLCVCVLFGVEAKAGLAAAEGDVHAGALVGHQGWEGLNLVGIDIQRVTDAALAGGSMVGVLGTVAWEDIVITDFTDFLIKPINGFTGFLSLGGNLGLRKKDIRRIKNRYFLA